MKYINQKANEKHFSQALWSDLKIGAFASERQVGQTTYTFITCDNDWFKTVNG